MIRTDYICILFTKAFFGQNQVDLYNASIRTIQVGVIEFMIDLVQENLERRKISILNCECWIFTGNLFHSDSSYQASNRRLCFKPSLTTIELPENADDTTETTRLNYTKLLLFIYNSKSNGFSFERRGLQMRLKIF